MIGGASNSGSEAKTPDIDILRDLQKKLVEQLASCRQELASCRQELESYQQGLVGTVLKAPAADGFDD